VAGAKVSLYSTENSEEPLNFRQAFDGQASAHLDAADLPFPGSRFSADSEGFAGDRARFCRWCGGESPAGHHAAGEGNTPTARGFE